MAAQPDVIAPRIVRARSNEQVIGFRADIAREDGIEADSRWIVGTPAAGLAIGFVDISGVSPTFNPSLSVDGIGIRIGKASGPLLDSVIKLGSVAAHFYADISQATFSTAAFPIALRFVDLRAARAVAAVS